MVDRMSRLLLLRSGRGASGGGMAEMSMSQPPAGETETVAGDTAVAAFASVPARRGIAAIAAKWFAKAFRRAA